ncbi:hypothetical protein B0H17DRAFT_174402 [Mycena rosella]|uniref:Uncharacterized protein n=1 Tax=Mycena rosella TaxID=1033263 RepID=A0AAD7GB39_MYCRO|nr:hypothetical protein B0H17DRAFT_174402 [Mycena rosella]
MINTAPGPAVGSSSPQGRGGLKLGYTVDQRRGFSPHLLIKLRTPCDGSPPPSSREDAPPLPGGQEPLINVSSVRAMAPPESQSLLVFAGRGPSRSSAVLWTALMHAMLTHIGHPLCGAKNSYELSTALGTYAFRSFLNIHPSRLLSVGIHASQHWHRDHLSRCGRNDLGAFQRRGRHSDRACWEGLKRITAALDDSGKLASESITEEIGVLVTKLGAGTQVDYLRH